MRSPLSTRSAVTAVLATAALVAATGCSSTDARPTEQEITGLFDQWNSALATGNATTVADLYAADGILLPTLSPVIRSNREQITQYFSQDFLPKHPQGTITESHVRILDDRNATRSGNYRFALTAKDGTRSTVDARFTYVYEKIDGRWLIVEHHSSAAPAPAKV
ncbi:SgcJ/EcaC family oxidoreductase [Kribbella antibiotica]|uniref:SgcJ/EcaC family oxidoreductase n=1 Tax=Kribbella antibiotica TaxID=190195 RepID=A0A4R4ZW11_9ACTN|nr:SgcJ/EcaC family oxidoreductase [Kribbella antibiotica]TDD63418.1 SgcJ/EcaC family oxidoreductase [Kribbella antibiotica]